MDTQVDTDSRVTTMATLDRSGSPAGPRTLLGSNVVDMDEGTPNIQYVDQTGDVGGPWYYQVAAWNDACGAEGPW